MPNERVIVGGRLPAPAGVPPETITRLELSGNQRNVNLKLSDISGTMAANIPDILVDLLEIATYVYCADQATIRGNSARNYGAGWRRRFKFYIPVRQPNMWSSPSISAVLRETLEFLSDDEYDVTFTELKDPPSLKDYLDFGPGGATGFQADEVILFSGGIDSLAGAVQETATGKKVALVSHRSAPQIAKRQRVLIEELARRSHKGPLHVPVWINKDKALGREYTQRTRSFLYACLAAVVARIFDLWRIRFYENGVVSINLPISAQVIGGRATRTTHPQVLNGFAELFTRLFGKPFAVENPFVWMTKAAVVRCIKDAGYGELIKDTVSCTHVWEMRTEQTHCGTCSQCIDRRFSTLSAGCSENEDPASFYGVDLLRGPREPGESRTMLESYVRTNQRLKTMSDASFFAEYGEVHRVTQYISGATVDDAASRILDLHLRHATEVCDVITKGIRDYAPDIHHGRVPGSCLLVLALPDEYKRPAAFAEPVVQPVLFLDEMPNGTGHRSLLARIFGAGRFDGINKYIGSRELFFSYLLFKSMHSHEFAGQQITVVTERETVQELLKWRDEGYLRFTGKDEAQPANRLQKMWGEFRRQIEKEKKLKNLFTNLHKDSQGQKFYAMCVRPEEKQLRITSILALFDRTKR
jgi:hypothetical protein